MLMKIEILFLFTIDENRDTVSIYNLLKENLDMWVSEEEGEQ